MAGRERKVFLFGKRSFRGGVRSPQCKEQTAGLAIQALPAPPRVIIPLLQHTGARAQPVVRPGDRVKIGQLIGEAVGPASGAVHASVSGTVVAVSDFPHPWGTRSMAVEIENDGAEESSAALPPDTPWHEASPAEIVRTIAACGVVGLSGSSPALSLLTPPADRPIDTLIVNGAECEPYLTADHRLMLERTEAVLTGALIVKKLLGAGRALIAVADNKADVIGRIAELLVGDQFSEISLVRLRTKYPQGGERLLTTSITKREVPSGGTPADVGCSVHSVATLIAIRDAVCEGLPLYQRVICVAGPTVQTPANLLVRIGTPIGYVLDHCGIDRARTAKVVAGGPMRGVAQADLGAPVIKPTAALFAGDRSYPATRRYPCINCGSCVKACPMHLVPTTIAKFVDKRRYGDAAEWHAIDCIECGSCAYVCPSKINLVHFMKLGKFHAVHRRPDHANARAA